MKEYFGINKIADLEAEFVRIDCDLNLPLDYECLLTCLHQPRVKSYQWIINGIGAKSPKWGTKKSHQETVIYPSNIHWQKLDALFHEGILHEINKLVEKERFNQQTYRSSRLEVRFFGKKLPVKKLEDFKKIADINVFSHLESKYVPDTIVEDLPFKHKIKLWAFLYRSRVVGKTQARKEFSKHCNLKTDIERYFIDLEELDLFKIWQSKMKKFFAAQSSIIQAQENQNVEINFTSTLLDQAAQRTIIHPYVNMMHKDDTNEIFK